MLKLDMLLEIADIQLQDVTHQDLEVPVPVK
jgi:hypothetical protein